MSRFWSFARRGRTTEEVTTDAVDVASEPVEVYTADAVVGGLLATGGRRISDILNSSSGLDLLDPWTATYLDGDRSNVEEVASGWVDAHEILFVAPPVHTSRRELRVHRHHRRLRVTIAPFEISGTIHMRPGTQLDHYVSRSPHQFVPLTNAVAVHQGEPGWETVAPVLLVNSRRITYLTDVAAAL